MLALALAGEWCATEIAKHVPRRTRLVQTLSKGGGAGAIPGPAGVNCAAVPRQVPACHTHKCVQSVHIHD